MGLYEFLLIVIILVMMIGFYLLERRERRELNNRLMARDFKEFKYYEKKFDKDIKEDEKIHAEARTERVEASKVLRDEYVSTQKTERDVADEIDAELDEAIEEPTKEDEKDMERMDKEFEDR